MINKTCCVFLGAATPVNSNFIQAAKDIGPLFKQANLKLIYGGAQRGLMGTLADHAINAGVHTTGIMSDDLAGIETIHPKLDKLIQTTTINLRKEQMIERSDFFIALPGGVGTYEEVFSAWCHIKINNSFKKIGLLNIDGFYDPFLASIDVMEREKFITPAHKEMIICEQTPDALIKKLMHR